MDKTLSARAAKVPEVSRPTRADQRRKEFFILLVFFLLMLIFIFTLPTLYG